MPFIEASPSVRLYYEDWGSGPCILFVHGFSMSHEIWRYQTAELSDSARVIAIDLRGHGDSDKPNSRYSHDEFALDLLKVMENLDLSDVNLVGWSLGGSTALRYMKNHGHRISRLVVVGEGPCFYKTKEFPYGVDPNEDRKREAEWTRDEPQTARSFVRSLFWREPGEATIEWLASISLRTPLIVKKRISQNKSLADHRDMLKTIGVPTGIFHGRYNDIPVEAARFMVKQIPNARHEIFQSGHASFIEAKDDFNKKLMEFLGLKT